MVRKMGGRGADIGNWNLQEFQQSVPERGFTLEIMLVIFLIGLQCGRGTDVCDRFRAAREKAAQDFLTRFAQFKGQGSDRRAKHSVC